MHLNRLGFNMIVCAYLAPLLIIDLVSNTVSEGLESEFHFWKFAVDGLLAFFAIIQVIRGFSSETATVANARARQVDHSDDVVSFENIHALEWIYCLILSGYAAVNFYFMHDLNKHSTGFVSLTSLIWSFVSIAVCVLAGMQFYHLKSGAIVELKKKVTQ